MEEPGKYGHAAGQQLGMVAQDVEKVIPQWVSMDKEGYKVLRFQGFEALATEAIKELKIRNEALEDRVKDLEERLSKLEEIKR